VKQAFTGAALLLAHVPDWLKTSALATVPAYNINRMAEYFPKRVNAAPSGCHWIKPTNETEWRKSVPVDNDMGC
jgi:hypothetical protein